MSFSDFNSHTNQLFMDLKLLKVGNIIDLQHLNLVYDLYDNRLPIDLKNIFTFSSDIHNANIELNSARKKFIHIPRIKTVTYRVRPPECWSNFKCDFRKDRLTSGFAATFVN